MESKEYIKDMLKGTNKLYLLTIVEYIRYMARDNKRYEVDDFLEELQDEIEKTS